MYGVHMYIYTSFLGSLPILSRTSVGVSSIWLLPMCAWFLEIAFVHDIGVCMYVCACVCPRRGYKLHHRYYTHVSMITFAWYWICISNWTSLICYVYNEATMWHRCGHSNEACCDSSLTAQSTFLFYMEDRKIFFPASI